MTVEDAFWRRRSLEELSKTEWESLCDGCAQCCLIRLEDDETGKVYKTSAACRQLDIESCRCKDYENRFRVIPGCLKIDAENVRSLDWLPDTCAYRLIAAGRDLPEWHPLVGNNVEQSGVSVRFFAQSEEHIHPEQLIDCIIE